jgi:hypothetical protein
VSQPKFNGMTGTVKKLITVHFLVLPTHILTHARAHTHTYTATHVQSTVHLHVHKYFGVY